ncbi:MAG TPA: PIG-L deacetylase family protein [Tepidisphaeraceae bacterium]|nr:PIG-L deacetylase family protein [Tepidisphaeraceae bacterium]
MTSTRRVVLSFLAHPDDAEILCAGTLIRLADAGWEVHIATATAGDCGTMNHDRWEISSIRTRENLASAAKIGATYHCLDERDGMVVYDKPTLQKAIDLFRRVAPSLVFTHAVKDYMMDHEMASLLARHASFMYGAPNISAHPLLAGSGVPHLYYCDPIEGIDPLGHPVEPTTVIDISRQLDRKTEMLACHASQREWLRAHHGMDEYIEAMKRFGADRGKKIGAAAAEGFVQHRGHPYPQDDLLKTLFV